MSINIRPDLETRLRARAKAENELERLALEGLDSGEPIAGDAQFWEKRVVKLSNVLTAEMARHVARSGSTEQEILADFESWRKTRSASRRRR